MRQSTFAAIVFVVLATIFVWRFFELKHAAKTQLPVTSDAGR